MRKSKNRYFYEIYVFPGDAPGAITLNVVWMERESNAHKLSRSKYPSIFNSFPVIYTRVQKIIAIFTYRSQHFCFPWRGPCDYHAIFAWMERQFNACQTLCSCTYLSSIVSELYDDEVNA